MPLSGTPVISVTSVYQQHPGDAALVFCTSNSYLLKNFFSWQPLYYANNLLTVWRPTYSQIQKVDSIAVSIFVVILVEFDKY